MKKVLCLMIVLLCSSLYAEFDLGSIPSSLQGDYHVSYSLVNNTRKSHGGELFFTIKERSFQFYDNLKTDSENSWLISKVIHLNSLPYKGKGEPYSTNTKQNVRITFTNYVVVELKWNDAQDRVIAKIMDRGHAPIILYGTID